MDQPKLPLAQTASIKITYSNLHSQPPGLTSYKHSFPSTISMGNRLPTSVVEAETYNQFKVCNY